MLIMNLEETIYKRQSIRNYKEEPLNDDEIGELRNYIDTLKVLNENICWSYEIVSKDNIKSILPWRAPHYLLLYSEEKRKLPWKHRIHFSAGGSVPAK